MEVAVRSKNLLGNNLTEFFAAASSGLSPASTPISTVPKVRNPQAPQTIQ
jgi:hypothetical protein